MYLVGYNKWHPTVQYAVMYFDTRRYHTSSKYNRHLTILLRKRKLIFFRLFFRIYVMRNNYRSLSTYLEVETLA